MKTQQSIDGNQKTSHVERKELVILVHGIWMTGLEMALLARRLRKEGFNTRRFFYPSLRSSPADNAKRLYRFIKQLQVDVVHLVAHSLGGIVLLHLFDRHRDIPSGRVVLMGSPVAGSGVAKRLDGSLITRTLLGRSREEGLLGGTPGWKGGRDIGVIAGSSGIGVGSLVGGLTGPGDGTVAISETKLPGADDYCLIPANHMGMVISPAVATEVNTFLQTGHFSGKHAVSDTKKPAKDMSR